MYLKITESFNELSVNTDTIDAENDALTETFSVLLYDRTTKLGNITEGNIREWKLASDKKYPSKSSVSRWPCMGPNHVPPNETAQPWSLQRFGDQNRRWIENNMGSAPWSTPRAFRELMKCGCKKDCDHGCRCRCNRVTNTMTSASTARGTVLPARC